MTRKIIAIGQFPPPINGFSIITKRMVETLSETCEVDVLNISSREQNRGGRYHLSRLARCIQASWILATARSREVSRLYMACEGNIGLIYTLSLSLVARMFRYEVYLHHHSFGYIDSSSFLMRRLLSVLGNRGTHIFLCAAMRDKFSATYSKTIKSVVVSNAAFVPPISTDDSVEEGRSAPYTIGLLSNLNREKGLYLFLELIKTLRAKNLNIAGILAGPVMNAEDRAAISDAKDELGDFLEYRGSVYGQDKEDFFSSIDCFIFPTTYTNEAQPTVIFEAQSAGLPVISYDRGCIIQQVGGDGIVFSREEPFASEATKYLARILSSEASSTLSKSMVKGRFLEKRSAALAVVRSLFDEKTHQLDVADGC